MISQKHDFIYDFVTRLVRNSPNVLSLRIMSLIARLKLFHFNHKLSRRRRLVVVFIDISPVGENLTHETLISGL